jgi:hypothetical protein
MLEQYAFELKKALVLQRTINDLPLHSARFIGDSANRKA